MKFNELENTLRSDDDCHKKVGGLPPVECWQPVNCSPLDICILDNGDWLHEGIKITRQSLVDLFASVLWVECDELGNKTHFLKTPTDKYQIRVVDTPLFINSVWQVEQDGISWIEFGTTNGDRIRFDDEHLPYFSTHMGEERLYVPVRLGLVARLFNNVFFHLVALGQLSEKNNKVVLKLASGGKIYELIA